MKIKYQGGPRNGKVEVVDSIPRIVFCHEEAKEKQMMGCYRLGRHRPGDKEQVPVLTWRGVPA